jgi:UDP-4-amino-4,6-dideoxy-N-acetyl-beta-L-altrosamine N-acetyltransferase
MFTNHIISEQEHFAWIDRIVELTTTRVYVVKFESEIIGGVSLNAISPNNNRADWAFYLDEKICGRGLGKALEWRFLDMVFFSHLEPLEKLNCDVLEFNEPVIAMHKHFGFIQEGIRRNHILRDGVYVSAVFLGITRNEWTTRRAALKSLR